jgi:hypothetical protein
MKFKNLKKIFFFSRGDTCHHHVALISCFPASFLKNKIKFLTWG